MNQVMNEAKNYPLPVAALKVSVIVVTFRSTHELPVCVESVLNQHIPLELFLVDNASGDDTPRMVADYAARHENVHAILNTENIGLAAANNCPIGNCNGEYVLLLNPDTMLPDGSLARMVGFLDENPDVGVLGPKNLYEDGSPLLSYHNRWNFWSILIWRVIPNRLPRLLGDRYSKYKFKDVMFVSGSCLLMRRGIFEQIGGYDPEYFLTIEDVVDLCIRARQTGCRVVFFPQVEMYHYLGRSGMQVPYFSVWHGSRGTIYHFLKHNGTVSAVLVTGLLIASALTRLLIASILSIAKPRYRKIAGIYAKLLPALVLENPIWQRKAGNISVR
jgi:GT2 family glycosyltransferase